MRYIKFILIVLFILVFSFSIWLDFYTAIYTNWTFLWIIVFFYVGLFFWIIKSNIPKIKWVVIFIGASLIFSIRYWDYSSLKPFMRTFNSLEKGMTKSEVLSHMNCFKLSGTGNGFIFLSEKEAEPELDKKVEVMNFTHTEEGWGDSDWGFVYFLDGKLYRTGFSPD